MHTCHFSATTPAPMVKRSRRRSSSPSSTDINRLLDPSYLPHSASSASSSPDSIHAYVDDHGDLHDPDYRDFPILVPATRRPAWEGSSTEDEDDDSALLTRRPVSPRERRRERYNAEYKAYARPGYLTYSSPSSHETREKPHAHSRRKLRALSPRRDTFASDSDSEDDADELAWGVTSSEPAEREPSTKEEYAPSRHQPEWTPTCGDQIRRQWQAISLSFRFSVFRMQRRIRHKLAS